MDKIVINQELLLLLQKNKIIATTSNFNYRDQAVISLIKTLITMGYNSSDILELIDEEMTLLDILEFHQDLVIKKYNLSASTLRYYEKEGLLPKIKKNQSNQRVYDDDDLSWLDIIMCMRKTGMTIAYIKNYIELCQEGDNTINQRYEIFLKQKEILLLQQQELEKNIETVNYKINLYKEKLLK